MPGFRRGLLEGKSWGGGEKGCTQPLRILWRSDAQTPQWVILISTSVSAHGLGVKARCDRGEVGEVACQPWKVSGAGDAMVMDERSIDEVTCSGVQWLEAVAALIAIVGPCCKKRGGERADWKSF